MQFPEFCKCVVGILQSSVLLLRFRWKIVEILLELWRISHLFYYLMLTSVNPFMDRYLAAVKGLAYSKEAPSYTVERAYSQKGHP